jgi:ABC-2 type transport system permease protein
LWPAVLGTPWHVQHWLALFGFAALFAALAAWGYRRDEGQRFR